MASWLQSTKKAKPSWNASADKTFMAWTCLAVVSDRISSFSPFLLTEENLTNGFPMCAANDLERKGLIWIISLQHICCEILKVLALRKIQSLAKCLKIPAVFCHLCTHNYFYFGKQTLYFKSFVLFRHRAKKRKLANHVKKNCCNSNMQQVFTIKYIIKIRFKKWITDRFWLITKYSVWTWKNMHKN